MGKIEFSTFEQLEIHSNLLVTKACMSYADELSIPYSEIDNVAMLALGVLLSPDVGGVANNTAKLAIKAALKMYELKSAESAHSPDDNQQQESKEGN